MNDLDTNDLSPPETVAKLRKKKLKRKKKAHVGCSCQKAIDFAQAVKAAIAAPKAPKAPAAHFTSGQSKWDEAKHRRMHGKFASTGGSARARFAHAKRHAKRIHQELLQKEKSARTSHEYHRQQAAEGYGNKIDLRNAAKHHEQINQRGATNAKRLKALKESQRQRIRQKTNKRGRQLAEEAAYFHHAAQHGIMTHAQAKQGIADREAKMNRLRQRWDRIKSTKAIGDDLKAIAAPKAPAGPKAQELVKHQHTGKLVSKKNKTGRTECSQAMSDWKRGHPTPQTFTTLAKCRAIAAGYRRAQGHREAGREAMAQTLEKRFSGQHVTQKERLARAQELWAQRASGKQTAAPQEGTQAPAQLKESTRDLINASRRNKTEYTSEQRTMAANSIRSERQADRETAQRQKQQEASIPLQRKRMDKNVVLAKQYLAGGGQLVNANPRRITTYTSPEHIVGTTRHGEIRVMERGKSVALPLSESKRLVQPARNARAAELRAQRAAKPAAQPKAELKPITRHLLKQAKENASWMTPQNRLDEANRIRGEKRAAQAKPAAPKAEGRGTAERLAKAKRLREQRSDTIYNAQKEKLLAGIKRFGGSRAKGAGTKLLNAKTQLHELEAQRAKPAPTQSVTVEQGGTVATQAARPSRLERAKRLVAKINAKHQTNLQRLKENNAAIENKPAVGKHIAKHGLVRGRIHDSYKRMDKAFRKVKQLEPNATPTPTPTTGSRGPLPKSSKPLATPGRSDTAPKPYVKPKAKPKAQGRGTAERLQAAKMLGGARNAVRNPPPVQGVSQKQIDYAASTRQRQVNATLDSGVRDSGTHAYRIHNALKDPYLSPEGREALLAERRALRRKTKNQRYQRLIQAGKLASQTQARAILG